MQAQNRHDDGILCRDRTIQYPKDASQVNGLPCSRMFNDEFHIFVEKFVVFFFHYSVHL